MKTIDFITIDYGLVHNTELLVKSIHKTIDQSKYDYRVIIVYQYEHDEQQRLDELKAIFAKDIRVELVKGVDQSDKSVTTSTIDGNKVSWPSTYGICGYQIGTDYCTADYICYVDNDSFFISHHCIDEYIKKADQYFFASSRYDTAKHFNSGTSNGKYPYGMAWAHLMMIKRANLLENDLRPELTYRDSVGNLTLFCIENELEYYVFPCKAGAYAHTCSNRIDDTNDIEIPFDQHTYEFLNTIGGDFSLSVINGKYTAMHYHQYKGNVKDRFRTQYISFVNNYLDSFS